MAAIPFYIVLGDYQIVGSNANGLVPQPGVDGNYWATYRNWPKLVRTVPASGTAFAPFWDGSITPSGAWTKYHLSSAAHQLTPIVAGANGDNWFIPSIGLPPSGGNFGSTSLLMQLLADKHPTAPYFKLFKYGVDAGFGGADGFKAGGTAFVAAMAELDDAIAALGSDTPDFRGIVLDASVSDIQDENLTYYADLASAVGAVRSHIGDTAGDVPVFLVNHAPEILQQSKVITVGALTDVPVAQFVRGLNASAAATLTNLYLVDMNGAKFSANSSATYAEDDPDPQWYSTEDVIQQGQKIYNALLAHEADAPSADPGSGIATYFLLGDSQCVGNLIPLHAILGGQESILGASPGTVRTGQYIWNDVAKSIQLYDLTSNANTFGTSTNAYYGPEATFLRRLAEEHPDGVLVVKLGLSGCALTLEAVSAGAINAFEESAGTMWVALQTAWNQVKIDAITNLNRVPDARGVAVILGDNETLSNTSATAFATKLPIWIARLRATLKTRSDGESLKFALLPPPKHVDAGGTSVLGLAAARSSVRATVEAAASSSTSVVSDVDLELLRSDSIHYAGEAQYEVGLRLAEGLISLVASSSGTSGGGTDSLTDGATTTTDTVVDGSGSDFAPTEDPVDTDLVVETGSGIADADSYLSLVEANARSIARGNPTEWSDATDAQKSNWLRQAAAAGIDIIFGPRWSGYRRTDTQSLDWPRIGASDSRTGRYVTETTVPTSVKWAQFEFALSLALGVDPLRNLDPSDPAERTAWASSTTDKLPGGLEESRTYDRGSPIYAVLARMEAFAAPLLMSDDQVGVA